MSWRIQEQQQKDQEVKRKVFRNLFWQENAQGLTEYAFILFLIAIACVVTLKPLGLNLTKLFEEVSLKIPS